MFQILFHHFIHRKEEIIPYLRRSKPYKMKRKKMDKNQEKILETIEKLSPDPMERFGLVMLTEEEFMEHYDHMEEYIEKIKQTKLVRLSN